MLNLSSTCTYIALGGMFLDKHILHYLSSVTTIPHSNGLFPENDNFSQGLEHGNLHQWASGFEDTNLSALLKPQGVGNSKLTAQMTHQLLSNFQKVKKALIYVMVDSTPVISTFCCCHSIQKVIPTFTLTDQENHNRCLNSAL
jgi:hypothetical protein